MHARVIVLAGPSGAGKSRLAEWLGLPLLRLDDYYKDGDDPSLPRVQGGPRDGLVDWDHPDAWRPDEAVGALTTLCATGSVTVPTYEIASNARTGQRPVHLGGAPYVVAEGIFAQDVVAALARADLLAAAYCVTRAPLATFVQRLQRDLRERRKPPWELVRRGLTLLRRHRSIVRDAVAKGCREVTPREARRALDVVRRGGGPPPR